MLAHTGFGQNDWLHPSALVWHQRRESLQAYWRQQKGYGKAEALLEGKWPEKYNSLGHLTWAGRIYGNGFTLPMKFKKERIFHGTWGSALFQSVYQPSGSLANFIPLMPEWYLLSAICLLMGCLGFLWSPLLWLLVAFGVSLAIVLMQAFISAKKNTLLQPEQKKNYKFTSLIILLHMIQPVARLYGRFTNGLTPWRKKGAGSDIKFIFSSKSRVFSLWSEVWQPAETWLLAIEKNLISFRSRIKRGGDFDDWDIQVNNGLLAKSRGLLTIEEHGGGKQYLRMKCKIKVTPLALLLGCSLAALSLLAAWYQHYLVSGILGFMWSVVLFRIIYEADSAINSLFIAFMEPTRTTEHETVKMAITEKTNAAFSTNDDSYHFTTEAFSKPDKENFVEVE